jgi:phosphoglycolate phosphatase-like HAD superfamily hydrolase
MKLIIFDIDGTLCDSDNIDDICFIQSFKDVLGVDIEDTNWDNYENITDSGITFQLFKEIYNRNPDEDEIRSLKARYEHLLWRSYKENPGSFREIDGSIKTFREINSMEDWSVGIGAGGWGAAARMKLRILKLDSLNIPFGCSDFHFSKVDIIKSLIDEIGLKDKLKSFEKIIYVGDREYDFKSAKLLKIGFIGIDFRRNGFLDKSGADKVAANYADGEFKEFLNI